MKMQPVQRRKRARRRVPAGAAWLIFHPSAFSSPCALVINQSMHDLEKTLLQNTDSHTGDAGACHGRAEK